MPGDKYTIKLITLSQHKDDPITIANLSCGRDNWPAVHIALERLKDDNPTFTYEAAYHEREAVSRQLPLE